MKAPALAFVTVLLALPAMAQPATSQNAIPLAPVSGEAMQGIPLAQVMATANMLGEWSLLSGGQAKVETVLTRSGGECGVSGLDDADTCGRFTLLVIVNGETSVPVDFALFRGPETLGWKVPHGARPSSDYGKFSIPLSACEMKKTPKGMGWMGTSYVLHIGEDLKTQSDGYGHYVFTAHLDKEAGERSDCAN